MRLKVRQDRLGTKERFNIYGKAVYPAPSYRYRDWTIADNDSNILGWYDTSDPTTVYDVGGVVYELSDKSGNDLSLLAGEHPGPTTGTRTYNNKNVFDCDGTELLDNHDFILPSSGDVAVYMVGEVDTVTSQYNSLFAMNEEPHPGVNDFQMNTQSAVQFEPRIARFGTSVDSTGGAFEGPSIYCAIFDWTDTGTVSIYLDGTQNGSESYATTKLAITQELIIFANRNEGAPMNGWFGEVVVCESCSSTCRQTTEGYLAHKWGLSGNLPSGHPYKSEAPKVLIPPK